MDNSRIAYQPLMMRIFVMLCLPYIGFAQTTLWPAPAKQGWGYIDSSGKLIVQPRFQSAAYYSDGLSRISVNNLFGFVDSSGNVVIPPQFTFADDFRDGLACVRIGSKFGFIDKTGKVVIGATLGIPTFFSDGFAVVRVIEEPSNLFYLIDKVGRKVPLPFVSNSITDYSDGVAWIETKGPSIAYGVWVAVDAKQHVLFSVPEEKMCGLAPGDFSEGLAIEGKFCNRKEGFISKTGQRVIDPLYDETFSFSEGLANVTVNNKTGFIDKEGKQVVAPAFDGAGSFSDGLAVAMIGLPPNPSAISGHWIPLLNFGFIDKTGKWMIKPIYTITKEMVPFISCTQIDTFKDGLAALVLPPASHTGDPLFEYIDRSGKVIYGPVPISATQMILETEQYLQQLGFVNGCASPSIVPEK